MKHMDAAREHGQVTALGSLPGEVVVEPSARAVYEPWMREHVVAIASAAKEAAGAFGVRLLEMTLAGFQPPDDDTREIILTCWVRGDDPSANAFWDELAETAARVNATVADTSPDAARLAVSVRWDD